ncbi:cysteine hydrolase family protein [Pirellulaceae bacterium SH467]|jgi:nicotinamidase-related amidase
MKRALLVIDVQMEYFTGALPISHPAGHLSKILEAFDAAREANIPIAVIRHHQPSADSPIFRKGSPEWELHPEIQARSYDILIDKTLPGSFTETPLSEWLELHAVKTISIAGYMTHMCCDTTARQGMHRGFQVEFLSDATGTLNLENAAGKVSAEELHRSILCAQQQMISQVLTTAEWIGRIRGTGH